MSVAMGSLARAALRVRPSTPAALSPVSIPCRDYGSKRSAKGLYGGKDIGFGNMVSHSERKTRRSWKPNVQSKRLWSEILQEMVPFKVTTHALKCVDKAGGLDNYLLHTKDLKSSDGERAKARVLEVLEAREFARGEMSAPTE